MSVDQNDVIRVDALLKYDGLNDVVNSYHLRPTLPGTISDVNAVTDILTFLEALYTFIVASINVIVTFRKVRVYNVTQDSAMGDALWPTLTAGTQAGDALPPGNAPLVVFDTAVKKTQLRKFGPPFSESSNNADGSLGAGVLTAYGNFANYLLSPQALTHQTWQYGHQRKNTTTFITPTSYGVGSVVGYQRRRRQGRGS